jgi:hypothetical protein
MMMDTPAAAEATLKTSNTQESLVSNESCITQGSSAAAQQEEPQDELLEQLQENLVNGQPVFIWDMIRDLEDTLGEIPERSKELLLPGTNTKTFLNYTPSDKEMDDPDIAEVLTKLILFQYQVQFNTSRCMK